MRPGTTQTMSEYGESLGRHAYETYQETWVQQGLPVDLPWERLSDEGRLAWAKVGTRLMLMTLSLMSEPAKLTAEGREFVAIAADECRRDLKARRVRS